MNERSCDVTVDFGSFASGIDGRAAARVEQLVGAADEVIELSRSPYGIEGEYRLCVRTRSASGAQRLFERLKFLLANPVRAPVTVRGPQGTFVAETSDSH